MAGTQPREAAPNCAAATGGHHGQAEEDPDRRRRHRRLAQRKLSGAHAERSGAKGRADTAGRIGRHRHPRCRRRRLPVDPRHPFGDRHRRSTLPARRHRDVQARHPLRPLGACGRNAGRGSLFPPVQPAEPARRRPRTAAVLVARRRARLGVRRSGDVAEACRRCLPRAQAQQRSRVPGAPQLRLPLRCRAFRQAARRTWARNRRATSDRHRRRRRTRPARRDHARAHARSRRAVGRPLYRLQRLSRSADRQGARLGVPQRQGRALRRSRRRDPSAVCAPRHADPLVHHLDRARGRLDPGTSACTRAAASATSTRRATPTTPRASRCCASTSVRQRTD